MLSDRIPYGRYQIKPPLNNQDSSTINWPPASVDEWWEEARTNAAFYEGDEVLIRKKGIELNKSVPELWESANYEMHRIPGKMADAIGDFLFSDPTAIRNDDDQENIDRLRRDNALDAILPAAAASTAAIGSVFWKAYIDPSTPTGRRSGRAQFIPPYRVIPEWANNSELIKATIVSTYRDARENTVRHLEIHEPGKITNQVWVGDETQLGKQVGITEYVGKINSFPSFDESDAEIDTEIDMLCVGYIGPRRGISTPIGRSIFDGLWDYFFMLNSALTKLEREVSVSGSVLILDKNLVGPDANIDLDNVMFLDSMEMASDAKMPIEQFTFELDSEPLIKTQEFLIEMAFVLAGLSKQAIGWNDNGGAESGTALQIRMINTLALLKTFSRSFEQGLAEMFHVLALLESKHLDGITWNNPDGVTTVEISDGMPRDLLQIANQIAILSGAGALSDRDKQQLLHPGFSDKELNDKVDEVRNDVASDAADAFTRLTRG